MCAQTMCRSEQMIFNQLKSLFGDGVDNVTCPIRKDQFCLHLQTVCREHRTAIKSGRDYKQLALITAGGLHLPGLMIELTRDALRYPEILWPHHTALVVRPELISHKKLWTYHLSLFFGGGGKLLF